MADDFMGSGFDPQAYVGRLFQIESGGNPYAVTGSNRGLGQFGPQEEAQYGITNANRADYGAQSAAVLQEAQRHAQVLQSALGRPPTPGELYLTHQQGIAGGPALLTADASTPAWQAIRPFYRSDAIAQRAIAGNIPSNNPMFGRDPTSITAGDFRNLWVSKFDGTPPSAFRGAPVPATGAWGGPAAQGATPALPASLATLPPTGGDHPPGTAFDPQEATASLLMQQRYGQQQAEGFDATNAAPPMQPQTNMARLRNVLAARAGQGMQLPPSIADRLKQLMGQG